MSVFTTIICALGALLGKSGHWLARCVGLRLRPGGWGAPILAVGTFYGVCLLIAALFALF